jgi:hypothetical protein
MHERVLQSRSCFVILVGNQGHFSIACEDEQNKVT